MRTRHLAGHSRGLTLIELLTVMSILAVLLVLATPSFNALAASTQLSSAKNQLILGLQRARSEAVTSGRNVVLCPSRDGLRCEDVSDWSHGWLLYTDNNRNSRFDPTEPLLLSQTLNPEMVSVRGNGGRRHVTYRSLGESAGSNASFVLCSRMRPELGGQVIIANSGRVRSLNFAPEAACPRA